jgi:uncharacterized membrane protein YjjB (DUF3815 family)
MIEHAITSFIASAAFGLLFDVPRNRLLPCGVNGMVGWIWYVLLTARGLDAVPACAAAAFAVAVISMIFAKYYKAPVILFNVSGIIPLVPGGLAYDAMRHFVVKDYAAALQLAAQAFLISGAIAAGLVLSEVGDKLIKRWKMMRSASGGG